MVLKCRIYTWLFLTTFHVHSWSVDEPNWVRFVSILVLCPPSWWINLRQYHSFIDANLFLENPGYTKMEAFKTGFSYISNQTWLEIGRTQLEPDHACSMSLILFLYWPRPWWHAEQEMSMAFRTITAQEIPWMEMSVFGIMFYDYGLWGPY